MQRIRTLGLGVLGAVAATVVAGAAPLSAAADAGWAGSVCASSRAAKSITVSLSRQELVACQGSRVFVDTLVTTGRPELPTPTGRYYVHYKRSPFVMRSTRSRHSRFWYPPSPVRWTLWFRMDGYAIHDAPWRAAYGPGTQRHGSHGCINVPHAAMGQLYPWAPTGTPVFVTG
ncbi:MAG: L,D-transpeptidase [Actinobacteria bacterium]|nr:L,D-transpeptidase [Actinomycetota bacterium]